MRRKNPYRELERRIGYRFRKRSLLELGLTHPSYRYEQDEVADDNQRLEFLGDAALGLAAAAHLYNTYSHMAEGEMTLLRSRATNTKTLALIAAELGLGEFLRLGKGELLSGGRERVSNLADALEGIVGAVYLDGGMKAVEKIFKNHWIPVIVKGVKSDDRHDNPKGALQEWAQKQWRISPVYAIVRQSGAPHARVYTAEVRIGQRVAGRGEGPNKQAAETEAARQALASETKHPAGKTGPKPAGKK